MPSATAHFGASDRRPDGRSPSQLHLVEGSKVEYYSATNECWLPTSVLSVDAETGAAVIDVKPGRPLELAQQSTRLRPITTPSHAQMQWVLSVLREGHLQEEAEALFYKHARREALPASCRRGPESEEVISLEEAQKAGQDIDSKLGTNGSFCALKHRIQHDGQSLTASTFEEVFWELIRGVQVEYCHAFQHIEAPRCRGDFRAFFDIVKNLGSGTYGEVKLVTDKQTGCRRAVKCISKGFGWDPNYKVDIEVEHLCQLDHPNIVKLHCHYEDLDNIYIVMDYCNGGELQEVVFDACRAKRNFQERWVKDVIRQVLSAVAHVHVRGIVHLDLKNSNVMLMPDKSTLMSNAGPQKATLEQVFQRPHVMVIDFGVAQIFSPGITKTNEPIGTPITMAPEVWRGDFTPKADVWSCGVMLFEILALTLPFDGPRDVQEARRYWNSNPTVPWSQMPHASDDAVHLCSYMLVKDKSLRLTASQCLLMPFVQGAGPESGRPIPAGMVEQLRKLQKRSLLHKSVALSIARALSANRLPTIKRLFNEIDQAGSGRLDKVQICAALERFGVERRRAVKATDAMDLDRDGTVSWTEFVASCIPLNDSSYANDLRRVFKEADSKGDGLLSQQDVARLLNNDKLSADEVRDAFVALAGTADPGAGVDWSTFQRYFQSTPGVPDAGGAGEERKPADGAPGAGGDPAKPPAEYDELGRRKPVEVTRLSRKDGFFDRR